MSPSTDSLAQPPESICTDCALCCNGALFDWVRVPAEELARLPAAGFLARGDAKGSGFAQPCPLLAGNLCSAYAVRPGGCRKFECNLLRRHKMGAVPRDEALEVIASARQLLGGVRDLLAPGESLPAARARWRQWFADRASGAQAPQGPAQAPQGPAQAAFLLRMTMLNRFLDRHFRKDRKKQMMEMDAD